MKTGAGVDFSYDGAPLEAQPTASQNVPDFTICTRDKFALGLLWNIEWVVGDLSLMEGLGYDVRNDDIPGRDNAFFQRAGVKYQFGKQKKTFGGILIRATNLYSARYVEWMIGRIVTWQ